MSISFEISLLGIFILHPSMHMKVYLDKQNHSKCINLLIDSLSRSNGDLVRGKRFRIIGRFKAKKLVQNSKCKIVSTSKRGTRSAIFWYDVLNFKSGFLGPEEAAAKFSRVRYLTNWMYLTSSLCTPVRSCWCLFYTMAILSICVLCNALILLLCFNSI